MLCCRKCRQHNSILYDVYVYIYLAAWKFRILQNFLPKTNPIQNYLVYLFSYNMYVYENNNNYNNNKSYYYYCYSMLASINSIYSLITTQTISKHFTYYELYSILPHKYSLYIKMTPHIAYIYYNKIENAPTLYISYRKLFYCWWWLRIIVLDCRYIYI